MLLLTILFAVVTDTDGDYTLACVLFIWSFFQFSNENLSTFFTAAKKVLFLM